MKQKISRILAALSLIALVSCGNQPSTHQASNSIPLSENSQSDTSELSQNPDVSSKPTSEQLAQVDDVEGFRFDNGIRMNGQEAADPFVFRFNGMYYLYPTSNGCIRGYKSADLVNWENVNNGVLQSGHVYEYNVDPNCPKEGRILYAPEVTYFNGKFYMITSPAGEGHYILESDSPEGPFMTITGNLQNDIDGSFFITNDEKVVVYGAGGSCIMAYQMEDDFHSFKKNGKGGDFSIAIGNASLGGWTEGPYLLQRYGEYYLTYTGNHYLNRDYRVDYAYAPAGSNVLSGSSFEYKDTLALSTTDEFWGLGHSCTVLGPDLDSYFMVYHNMVPGSIRYVNLSRLSFDGSSMKANDVRLRDSMTVDMPSFYAYDDSEFVENGNYIFSDAETGDDVFTVEFNTIGEGKMIFSYRADDDYSYILFENNSLDIHTVTDAGDTIVAQAELRHEFVTDAYHTYRLQSKDDRLAFYFDGMEKVLLDDVSFHGGKMGFEKEHAFEEIGFCAFSDYAFGSSDEKFYADTISYAANYDRNLSYITSDDALKQVLKEGQPYINYNTHNLVLANEGEFATYRMFSHEDANYLLEMRVPAKYRKRSFKLRIDGGEAETIQFNGNEARAKNGDSVMVVKADVVLKEGPHNITIECDGTEFGFSDIRYDMMYNIGSGDKVTFDSTFEKAFYHTRGSMDIDDKGLHTGYQTASGVMSNEWYYNATVKTTMKIEDIASDGYAGIVMNVKNSFDEQEYTPQSGQNFQGLFFGIDGISAQIYAINFSHTERIGGGTFTFKKGDIASLSVTQDNNTYCFFINDELVKKLTVNDANLIGQTGVFAHNADVSFLNMTIEG